MAEYRAGEFTNVPNIPIISQLQPTELVVFVYLCWRAGKDKTCFPSYSLIEKETGVSRRTVVNAVRELESKGWIKREIRSRSNGSHTSNGYKVMQVGGAKSALGSAKKDTGGSAKINTPLTITSKNNNHITSNEEELPKEASQLAERLFNHIVKRNPKLESKRAPSVSGWAPHIYKIKRLDGYDWQDITQVIDWCQTDTFWQNNILSGNKLRDQFAQLYLKTPRQAKSRIQQLMEQQNAI